MWQEKCLVGKDASSSSTCLCLCASCLCCISFYVEGRQGSCLAGVQMMPAIALGCVFVLPVCVVFPFLLRCGRKNVWLEKMPAGAAAALGCVFVLPVCGVFPFMLRCGRKSIWLENDASSSSTWLCLCASCLCCISFYVEGRQEMYFAGE